MKICKKTNQVKAFFYLSLFLRRYTFLLILLPLVANAQIQQDHQVTKDPSRGWYLSGGLGVQMSGIKSEDFIGSNFSPLVNITLGKWFSPELAIQAGYRGPYFHTIADSIKHNYTFLYGEAVFHLNNILSKKASPSPWTYYIHAGAGYFYNSHYSRPNICAIMGLQVRHRLSEKFSIATDISAIMGWDIYQGNEDILPGLSFVLFYNL